MADCNSVQNIWTSCFLLDAWVVSETMQHLFAFYNIQEESRNRPGEMAQRLRAVAVPTQFMSSILSNHMVAHNHM